MSRLFLTAAVAVVALIGAASAFEKKAPDRSPTPLTVPLGGTIRLKMKSGLPIKIAAKTADGVLIVRSVQGDPTVILLTGQTPDVTTLELTDVKNGKEIYEVKVQLDLVYLRKQLSRALPTANITPILSSDNAVILTGTVVKAEDVDIILRVCQSYSGLSIINAIRVGGVKQVQLDVQVVSVTGLSLMRMLPHTQRMDSPWKFTVLEPSGKADQLLQEGLKALKRAGLAQFITQSSLVTLSGQPATLLLGGEQAVPSTDDTSINFEPFGLQVTLLPIVLGNGKIHLEVAPSITDLDQAFGTTLCAAGVVPGSRRQSVTTTIQLDSGRTFMIRGLTRQITPVPTWQMPLLGEVPTLNTLFELKQCPTREELVILVRPFLLNPLESH